MPISPGRQLQEVAEQDVFTSQPFKVFSNRIGTPVGLLVGTGPGKVLPGTGIIRILN